MTFGGLARQRGLEQLLHEFGLTRHNVDSCKAFIVNDLHRNNASLTTADRQELGVNFQSKWEQSN